MKTTIKYLGIFSLMVLVSFKPIAHKKIVAIDASHGGKDNGATVGEFTEKKIVESISKKIKTFNKNEEIEIALIREGDIFMTLDDRVSKINTLNPDLLISLHINFSEDKSLKGIDAFASKENNFYHQSMENAKNLVEQVSNKNLMKREVRDANLFVIKNANCPALALELGYLSNENDKNYITSEEGQNEIATKIVESLKN